MTRQEVASVLNISCEFVKQIELKALRKLKKQFLKIDSEDMWLSYIHESKEKDPIEHYLDNNYSL